MCTQSVGSISVIHMGIQERKKRTEEKKQRRLENQKKAEVVQKVSIVISWTPPLPGQEGKEGEGVKQRADRSSLVPNVAFRKFRLIPAFQFFCM